MSDEDALLAAIAADPESDTPRLVYADWLDDHADPRAGYVRWEVERYRLKPRDKRRPELTARLEAFRPSADPHWLCRLDRVMRLTAYQSRADCRRYWATLPAGQPLARVGWISQQGNSPPVTAAKPGDYFYPIAVWAGRLYLLGRMRVRRMERQVAVWPPAGGSLGTEGTAVRLDRVVPAASLGRLGWYADGKGRQPVLTADGRLKSHVPLQGVLHLVPTAAAEFDRLLRDG